MYPVNHRSFILTLSTSVCQLLIGGVPFARSPVPKAGPAGPTIRSGCSPLRVPPPPPVATPATRGVCPASGDPASLREKETAAANSDFQICSDEVASRQTTTTTAAAAAAAERTNERTRRDVVSSLDRSLARGTLELPLYGSVDKMEIVIHL